MPAALFPIASRGRLLAAVLATAILATGCGDDDGPATDPDAGAGADAGDSTAPVYVIANEVYGADTSTTYVNVLRTLDVDEVDYTKAVEFAGGRATIATIGGWLFVAAPTSPVVTRYIIKDDGTLDEDGQISFANFGIAETWIDEWGNTFVSPTKAYLNNSPDGTTIVWNPTTMTITREIAPLQDLVRPNLTLNGSPGIVRGDRLYRTFFWTDWAAYQTSTDQFLAVYDVETDTMVELIAESRCPGLSNRIDRGDDGTLYFSNWVWNVTETLVRGAPRSCALRILPDAETFDATWTLPYADVTEGREAAMFAHLDGTTALLNVFHDERAEFDETSDPSELASTTNWRLWSIDMAGGTGAPVEGLDWMTGGASTFHLDDRAFVFIPGPDYASTALFEVEAGVATPAFEVTGWSYQFFRVR